MNFWIPDNDQERSKEYVDKLQQEYKNAPLLKEYAFKEKKQIKYKLDIQSKMNVGGISSENTVEIRWVITLKNITDDSYTFELLMLDNTMVQTNNDGFGEIHKLVTQMQKALNEIIFNTNRQGVVIKVININTIKEKWQAVKAEIIEYNRNMTSIQELFALQEQNFEQEGGVEKMVSAIEFFDICFNHIYGKRLPFSINKKIPNFFRTWDIPFNIHYENNKYNEQINRIEFYGSHAGYSENDMKKAYGNFPFIKTEKLYPQYIYKGNYNMNLKDGFIENGEILYRENVDPKLNAEIIYKISRYE